MKIGQADNPNLAFGATNIQTPPTDAILQSFTNKFNRGRTLTSVTASSTAQDATTVSWATSDGLVTTADIGAAISIAGAGVNGYPFNSVIAAVSTSSTATQTISIPHAIPTTVSAVAATIGTIQPGQVVAWDTTTATATAAGNAGTINSLGTSVVPATNTVNITATTNAATAGQGPVIGVAVKPIPASVWITTANSPTLPTTGVSPTGDVMLAGPLLVVSQAGGGTASGVLGNVPIKFVNTSAGNYNVRAGFPVTNDAGAMLTIAGPSAGSALAPGVGQNIGQTLIAMSTSGTATSITTGSVIVWKH